MRMGFSAGLARDGIVLAVLAGLAGATGAGAQPSPSPCVTVVPCADPRGCPDVVVERATLQNELGIYVQTFAPDSCEVQEGYVQSGTRTLVGFSTALVNQGLGDLEIGPTTRYPDLFQFATCHGHQHVHGYAHYRLWTPDGYARWRDLRAAHPGTCTPDLLARHPRLQREVVTQIKQGFCVVDIQNVCAPPDDRYFFDDCERRMGISKGWADVYSIGTDGQWVDVTGLSPGRYVLEAEVNPLRLIQESDYTNNLTAIMVTVP